MKKSTLIILVLAVGLGVFVYYHDWKNGPPKEESVDETKPVFSAVSSPDVTSITITRGSQAMDFIKKNNVWLLTGPLATKADQASLEGIAVDLSDARVTRTLTAAPNELQSYGLASPAVDVQFQMKNGAKHNIELGAKDFSGSYIYATVDGSRQVSLISESLLTSTDKPLDQLRDRSVLTFDIGDVKALDLRNSSGEIQATKDSNNWKIEKPRISAGDSSTFTSLLSGLADEKWTGVASETPTPSDLGKYGLVSPPVRLNLSLANGKQETLAVGKKVDSDYYARDTSRPTVFKIREDAYKKLEQKFFDFRDKNIYHFDSSQISRLEIQNASTREDIVATQDKDGDWRFEQPAGMKGKDFNIAKVSIPLDEASAKEILDEPPKTVTSKLAKPAVEVTLTDKAGKATTLRFSSESSGFTYGRSSAGPGVYKFDKKTLDDLNFKAETAVS